MRLKTEYTGPAARVTTGTPGDSTWPPAAADVLARACDHYGGRHAWRTLRRIRLVPGRLSGFLPWTKGAGRSFCLPSAFDIEPRERRTRFLNFPDDAHTGVFENGTVRIERRDTGEVRVEEAQHRRSFRGLGAYRRWSPIDALYFFGYAMSHYHALPFTLLEARFLGMRAAGLRRAPLDVLDVEFPADLPTHCRR
jgi:hypothetical protein